jgi:hypothetical protein
MSNQRSCRATVQRAAVIYSPELDVFAVTAAGVLSGFCAPGLLFRATPSCRVVVYYRFLCGYLHLVMRLQVMQPLTIREGSWAIP